MNIQYNDIGTVFRATIKDENGDVVDISSNTTLTMKFEKPSAATISRTATLTNTGTDGKMEYSTVDGDLDEVGPWKVQGYVVLSGGTWHSDVHDFTVKGNLS